jgi:hypothetical protein
VNDSSNDEKPGRHCMREEAYLHIPAREEAYLHDVLKKKKTCDSPCRIKE